MASSTLSAACVACEGTGCLLTEICPLCDGTPEWPEAAEFASLLATDSYTNSPEIGESALTEVQEQGANGSTEESQETWTFRALQEVAEFHTNPANLEQQSNADESWGLSIYGDAPEVEDSSDTVMQLNPYGDAPEVIEDSEDRNAAELPNSRPANIAIDESDDWASATGVMSTSYNPISVLFDTRRATRRSFPHHSLFPAPQEIQQTRAERSDSNIAQYDPSEAPPEVSDTSDSQDQESSLPESTVTGNILLLSPDGFFQLVVLMPMLTRPSFTEEDVAKIGSTWTHGSTEDVPSSPAARKTVHRETCGGDDVENVCCGICMDSFDHGDKLTTLPCATQGCSSVWHLPCIHKWLNQGRTPSCPLCRTEIDLGSASDSSPLFDNDSPLFGALQENALVRGSSWLPRQRMDPMGALLHAMMLQSR